MLLEEHQTRLKNSTVTICGCGGLGTPAATYLAMAGIGTIHLFDKDTIEATNLNRQFMYEIGDIGKPKALQLATKLSRLNSDISIVSHTTDITRDDSIEEVLHASDIILDCLDSIKVRKVLAKKAEALFKPIIHGGIRAWLGQISVFYPKEAPSLTTLPELAPEVPFIPSLGVIPGIIGTIQALECIKMLLNFPVIDSSRMHIFNGFSFEWSFYDKQIFIPKE
jgi:adenylyltransferase/sulfurtransferase